MSKKVMFCYTPMQILISLAIKLDFYTNDDFTLVISDQITDYEDLSCNIRKTDVFSNVIILDEKRYKSRIYFQLRKIVTVNRRFAQLFSSVFFNKIDFDYDEFFFYNMDSKGQNIINIFAYAQKDECIFNFFEECAFINSPVMRIFFSKKKDSIFHYKFLEQHISKAYLVKPEKLCYDMPVDKIKINFPAVHKDYKKYVNIFFNYNESKNIKQKYIFFDTSLSALNCSFSNTNKFSILKVIKDIVHKRNLLIKLHPRYNTMEYDDDFIVNKTNIPWEVYLLNNQDTYNNKVLIGISSSSLVSSQYYFNLKIKVISLINMTDKPFQERMSIFGLKSIFDEDSNIYLCPKTLDELIAILESLK